MENKKNIIPKITLTAFVIVIALSVMSIGVLLVQAGASSTMAAQGYTWGLIFVLPVCLFFIAYYGVIFSVSKSKCKPDTDNKKWNRIIIALLVLPLVVMVILYVGIKYELTNNSCKVGPLKVSLPNTYARYSYRVNFDQECTGAGFFDQNRQYNCTIDIIEEELMQNMDFKSQLLNYDTYYPEINSILETTNTLTKYNKNGIQWQCAEIENGNTYVNIYGAAIQNKLYRVVIKYRDGDANAAYMYGKTILEYISL